MSWPFFLIPVPIGAVFTQAAIEEMGRWWERYPIYRRRNGAIALCRDAEHRDHVLATGGAADRVDNNIEGIVLRAENVMLEIAGWPDRIDVIADFVKFCQSKWPCELFEQTKRERMTAEEFRSSLHKTFDYP